MVHDDTGGPTAVEAERKRLSTLRRRRAEERAARLWSEFDVSSDLLDTLGDVVAQIVASSAGQGGAAEEALGRLLEGEPCPDAPHLLVELITTLTPSVGADYLAQLHDLKVPMVAAAGPAARLLAAPDGADSDQLAAMQAGTPSLRLWRDTELVSRGLQPLDLPLFVAHAPLAAVDDLIERHQVVRPEHWAERPFAERCYLHARIDPQPLTEAELIEADWPAEVERRSLVRVANGVPHEDDPELAHLLHDVGDGNVAALEHAMERLPHTLRTLVGQVRAHPGQEQKWPRKLLEDRAMWPILERMWDPGEEVITPRQDRTRGFAAWCALRAGYRRLLDVHVSAEEALRPFAHDPDRKIRDEAVNMLVYLDLRFSDPSDSEVLRESAARLAALQPLHPVVAANLRWLEERQERNRNERGPVFNPYLELGVDHGTPVDECRGAWRRLRRELRGSTGDLSDINQAHDMLTGKIADNRPAAARYFRLPLAPELLLPSARVPAALVPDAAVLPRRTAPVTAGEIEPLRETAAAELVSRIRP